MHPSSYDEMCSVFKKYLDMDSILTIIDIGSMNICGTYKALISPNWNYIGVDIEKGDNVDIVMVNNYILPFDDNSIDVVISGQCLEHVDRPWLLMKEIGRVLKKEGYCFVTAPAKWHIHKFPLDCWRIYPDGMRILLEDAGLKVLETYTFPADGLQEGITENTRFVDCWGVGKKEDK